MLERTDHQLCMPELMAAKLAATAPNGGSWESTTRVLPVPGDVGRERPGRLAGYWLKMASRRGQARR